MVGVSEIVGVDLGEVDVLVVDKLVVVDMADVVEDVVGGWGDVDPSG